MSCVLRISGTNLNIDRAIEGLPLRPYRVWRRGEPMSPRSTRSKIHESCGACFQVSSAGMDQFDLQQSDAIRFLEEHYIWLRKLREDQAMEVAGLDFGIERGEAWIQSVVFSPAFLAAAARTGISVELSSYGSSHEV